MFKPKYPFTVFNALRDNPTAYLTERGVELPRADGLPELLIANPIVFDEYGYPPEFADRASLAPKSQEVEVAPEAVNSDLLGGEVLVIPPTPMEPSVQEPAFQAPTPEEHAAFLAEKQAEEPKVEEVKPKAKPGPKPKAKSAAE